VKETLGRSGGGGQPGCRRRFSLILGRLKGRENGTALPLVRGVLKNIFVPLLLLLKAQRSHAGHISLLQSCCRLLSSVSLNS
jgi:hypothetical protein